MREKRIIKQIMVIFSLVTLVLLGLATFLLVKDIKNGISCYKVTVRITDEQRVGKDSYLYYVDYTVNGTKYSHVEYKPVDDNNAHIGGTEKAYVDKDNPYKIKRRTGPAAVIVLYIMGAMFLIIGVLTGFKEIRKKKIAKNFYVYAEIYDVVVDYSLSVNGVCPFVIKCRYTDPDTGEVIIFESEHCFDDPGLVYAPGEQVKVYLEDKTYKNYVVDLEKFESLGLG